jgi:hypothetical protein
LHHASSRKNRLTSISLRLTRRPPLAVPDRVRYFPGMGFGRNPHVLKAQAAEQKAEEASDDLSRARAYFEAAHAWDRAAEREKPGKQRVEYEAHATRTRALAE